MVEVTNSIETEKSGISVSKQIPYNCNIRAIRISLGLTQSALARVIGTTPNFVNMIEREHYYPILETRIKIARALKTDTSALWEDGKNDKY